jgi:polysaccharide biosynthesis/export protein
MRTATLLTVCAVFLGGCAGSSNNDFTAVNGANTGSAGSAQYTGPGDTGGYGASSADATFAATTTSGAAPHSGASDLADKLTAIAKPGNAAYKIGPLDVLDITVFKVPDLAKSVQVAENGDINYPLVGDIQAAGRTAHELERDLMQKLGAKYLRNPQVTVFVKEYNSQRVTVQGSVKTAGVYSIKGNTSLMQIIAMAGDVDMTVDSGTVVIFRTIDGQRSAARFDFDAIKKGNAADPQVQPGDIVYVDTSPTKVALSNILKALPLATTAAVFAGI